MGVRADHSVEPRETGSSPLRRRMSIDRPTDRPAHHHRLRYAVGLTVSPLLRTPGILRGGGAGRRAPRARLSMTQPARPSDSEEATSAPTSRRHRRRRRRSEHRASHFSALRGHVAAAAAVLPRAQSDLRLRKCNRSHSCSWVEWWI